MKYPRECLHPISSWCPPDSTYFFDECLLVPGEHPIGESILVAPSVPPPGYLATDDQCVSQPHVSSSGYPLASRPTTRRPFTQITVIVRWSGATVGRARSATSDSKTLRRTSLRAWWRKHIYHLILSPVITGSSSVPQHIPRYHLLFLCTPSYRSPSTFHLPLYPILPLTTIFYSFVPHLIPRYHLPFSLYPTLPLATIFFSSVPHSTPCHSLLLLCNTFRAIARIGSGESPVIGVRIPFRLPYAAKTVHRCWLNMVGRKGRPQCPVLEVSVPMRSCGPDCRNQPGAPSLTAQLSRLYHRRCLSTYRLESKLKVPMPIGYQRLARHIRC